MFRVFKDLRITRKCNYLQISPIVIKIRHCYIYKHFPIFNFEPVSPVPHSVKFSLFPSEYIVLKVEIARRSKSGFSPSSENSWIWWGKYRFSLQLYTRMHGFKDAFFLIVLEKAHPASPQTSILAQSLAAPSIWVSPSILGCLRHRSVESVRISHSIHPLQHVY